MVRKWFCLLAAVVLLASVCPAGLAGPRLQIVCTGFPQYDWIRAILGDRAAEADLRFLMGTGVDMHSYEPSVADIALIAGCDLFVFTGGESEQWARDVLRESARPGKTVCLLDALGSAARTEETVEGMQTEEAESGEPALDEHVWLSLKNARILAAALCGALCAIDGEHGEEYRANAEAYDAALSDLDARYRETVEASPVRTLLFADRFPFRYLTEDYGLDYYAAFPGCSAESEASFQTIIFLAGKVKELELRHICVIETSDGSLAETVLSSLAPTDADVVCFQSLQGTTRAQAEEGQTYLSVMEENLTVLAAALSQ